MSAAASDFAMPGGPMPANVDEIEAQLARDGYDMELLISFGTSKGGSAGHLALALRDAGAADDLVYSANFYADRDPKHANDFYTDDLMTRVPKKEYLFGTSSSLGPKASFGLDYGEIYKRSVVSIRVKGVPADERAAIAAYFARMNDDYHKRAPKTEYHDREIKYDYFHLNCAKTIGAAFKYGAGYKDLDVSSATIFRNRRLAAIANANIPTEMAMKLVEQFNARGYTMDAVLYRKYRASPYVDPHDEEKIAFKDLPNRFPSVMSIDFTNDESEYEDYDNLYAMYLLHNMGRYAVRVDGTARALEIDRVQAPLSFADAKALAQRDAQADSRGFLRRLLFRPKGTRVDAD
jgi:hypothetical protein